MRRTWTPSIVPRDDDDTVYLVVNDFGRTGVAFVETDIERTDLETVISDLMDGQHSSPIKVIAFNTAAHWSRDVSADIAREIQRRADLANQDLSSSIEDFVQRHVRSERQLTLRLA